MKDSRHRKIHEIVLSLGEKTSATSNDDLFYQINLLDKPHAITWKEFSSLFDIWRTNKDLAKINEWIDTHINDVIARKEETCDELFSTTVSYRLKRLEDASSVSTKGEHAEIMVDVASSRELIEHIVSEGLPDLYEGFFRSAQKFNAIFKMVTQWIHFRGNAEDIKERKHEEKLLLDMASYAKENVVGYVYVIAPWDEEPSWDDKKLIIHLRKKLSDIVLPLLADELIAQFETKGGIASLWGHGQSLPQKYVLFDSESFLWASPRKEKVVELLKQATTVEHINQNAYEFIRMITYGEENGLGLIGGQEMIQKLIRDKEIVGAIWVAAVSRPIQYRGIKGMKEKRAKLAAIAKSEDHLPWPEWLPEKDKD